MLKRINVRLKAGQNEQITKDFIKIHNIYSLTVNYFTAKSEENSHCGEKTHG